MGNTAVAVLHYDMHDQIEKADRRMGQAMLDMPGSAKPCDFGFGRIISWDHSSGHQVCVIYGNTGWRLGCSEVVPEHVLKSIAAALRDYGWKCTPPKDKPE